MEICKQCNIYRKRKNINIEALTGDNLKLLSALDLNKYDIIDLDAYGTPSNQLEIIKKKSTKENQYICLTMIQSGIGGIPNKVLNKNNITTKMLKKAKTIFYKNYQQKMYTYLIKLFKNIKIIHWYSDSAKRKNYAIIQINLDKSL